MGYGQFLGITQSGFMIIFEHQRSSLAPRGIEKAASHQHLTEEEIDGVSSLY
jgi:hypothetical protein